MFINEKALTPRVRRLKEKGVTFSQPGGYPPSNMDSNPAIVRSVYSTVTTAELLVRNIPGRRIHVEPTIPGEGDVDIRIKADTPTDLQIKDINPLWVDLGGNQAEVTTWMHDAMGTVLHDLGHSLPVSTFTRVEIKETNGRPSLYGRTQAVFHEPVRHLISVEASPDLLQDTTRKRVEKRINKARVALLKAEGSGTNVPVVSLMEYPHDQHRIVNFIRCGLQEDRWPGIGGILLLTSDYRATSIPFVSTKTPRLIPIPNPNSPPKRRLVPALFNRNLDDEFLHREGFSMVSVFDQNHQRVLEKITLRHGTYHLGGVPFGPAIQLEQDDSLAPSGAMGPIQGPPPFFAMGTN